MSLDATKSVWRFSKSRGGSRLVLLAIADHINGAGTCWPSVPTLCSMTGLSERTVQGALKDLVSIGEIHIRPNGGQGGANIYTFLVSDTPAEIAPPPRKDCAPQNLRPPAENDVTPRSSCGEPPQFTAFTPAESAPKPIEPLKGTVRNHYCASDAVIPKELNSPRFATAWKMWNDYRKQAKIKPYTEIGATMQLSKLAKLGETRAIAAIEHSAAQGYQGIFEPKVNGNGTINGMSPSRQAANDGRHYPGPQTVKTIEVPEDV